MHAVLRAVAAALTLALSAAPAHSGAAGGPDAGAQRPVRVLFIGNSYTFYHRMPATVSAMASADDAARPFDTKVVAIPGATLQQHWDNGAAVAAIRERRWDYVVLQEHSRRPLLDRPLMHRYASLLHQEIQRSGARTVFFATWPRRDHPQTLAGLKDAYESIAAELRAKVAPVGAVWQRARERDPGLELYTDDGSHPTATASYLVACTLYLTLRADRARCPVVPAEGVSPLQAERVSEHVASALPALGPGPSARQTQR
ncbi:MAG: SGNH/GDSL hydrolase family protein [Pseudomonadota bacterium]